MHDLYFKMGAQSLRVGRSILLGLGVLIYLVVSHPTREFLIGLNEAVHRGRQVGVGGGKGGIVPHQFFQNILLSGIRYSEGIQIFVEVSSRPGWTIYLIWFRRLPKRSLSGAQLVLASNGLLLDLGLLVCCLVQIFPGRPIFFRSWEGPTIFHPLGGNALPKSWCLSQ